jgi:hypothetical protein
VAVREWMGLGLCYSNFRIPAAKGRPTNGLLVFFFSDLESKDFQKKKQVLDTEESQPSSDASSIHNH